ncbi:MAG TPA: hypothetical protein VJS44_00575 [Pyrinomonadaceae bacterium]|nr:hypothetical protein [Pyrinomonadaceae bacterium]
MKNRILLTAAFAALAIVLSSCGGGGANSNANTSNTGNKPANSNAGAANANSAKTGAKPPEPKTEIKNEKKPEGQQAKGLPADKKVPVPANWIYYSDEVKGYGFWLPEGSVGDSSNVDGTDVFVAKVPEPSNVRVEVYAWKDKTLTKEDLLKMTVDAMKEQGENVTAGNLQGESDDYALAEASSVDVDGKKYKMKILVGTDVTDNYVMVVYTDQDKYEANKSIVDAIWGSFEMYSGGASGNS